jgi:hypothetical protein
MIGKTFSAIHFLRDRDAAQELSLQERMVKEKLPCSTARRDACALGVPTAVHIEISVEKSMRIPRRFSQ